MQIVKFLFFIIFCSDIANAGENLYITMYNTNTEDE